MLAHHHTLGLRVSTQAFANPLAQGESGPDVVHPNHSVAPHLRALLLAVGQAGKTYHRIRMGVIHMDCRCEAMQQRLDRLARSVESMYRVGKILDHLFVRHLIPGHQRKNLGLAQTGKPLLRDCQDIAARTLDPKHFHIAPQVVLLR